MSQPLSQHNRTIHADDAACFHTILPLHTLLPGNYATVHSLRTSGDMRRRLLDIGLTPGTKILCLGQSPLGDPVAFLIRGAVIALRKKDCQTILIDHTPSAMQPQDTKSVQEDVLWD